MGFWLNCYPNISGRVAHWPLKRTLYTLGTMDQRRQIFCAMMPSSQNYFKLAPQKTAAKRFYRRCEDDFVLHDHPARADFERHVVGHHVHASPDSASEAGVIFGA